MSRCVAATRSQCVAMHMVDRQHGLGMSHGNSSSSVGIGIVRQQQSSWTVVYYTHGYIAQWIRSVQQHVAVSDALMTRGAAVFAARAAWLTAAAGLQRRCLGCRAERIVCSLSGANGGGGGCGSNCSSGSVGARPGPYQCQYQQGHALCGKLDLPVKVVIGMCGV